MIILSADSVSYAYKSKYQIVEAVRNISCSFETGKMYAITGESGSGKTSFLSLLAGLDCPTNGKIIYDGKDTAEINLTNYRKNNISIIYQAFNLFPLLTVLQNVRYPLELKGVSVKEAEKAAKVCLEQVGLDETKYNRRPSMLSGGEQQRVAVARALAKDANVLLADEPTGNLDSENTENITALLKNISRDKNIAVIVVTHDESLAAKSDVVYSMKDGRLLQ